MPDHKTIEQAMSRQKTKKCMKRNRSVLPQLWSFLQKIKKTARDPITNKGNGRKLPSNPKTNKPTQGKNH
jgi:hypothetical protein